MTRRGSIVSDDAQKWLTDARGAMWFFSGSPVDIPEVIEIFGAIDGPQKIKAGKSDLDFGAVVISNGVVYFCYAVDSSHYIAEVATHSEHFGSGGMSAMCAINLGKGTAESVEFAKTMDAYTGGNVNVFCVKEMRFK